MASPTVRRWELARSLRQLREEAGLRIEDVADRLECSSSKVSRLETAARGASLRDVRDLCDLYGVGVERRNHLLRIAREAKQQGWWQAYDEVASWGETGTFLGLEEAATAIRQYQTILVPGAAQVAGYTRALVRRLAPGISSEAIEQFVESRAQRKRILDRQPRTDYWAILDEAVLKRQVGGPEVLKDQLGHLADLMEDERLTLQIVPFEAGAHAGMNGSFTMLQFAEGTMGDVVLVESRSGQLFLNRPAELLSYREAVDHLRAVAASPESSLLRVRDEIQRLG